MEIDKTYRFSQTCSVPNIQAQLWFFDVTFCVNIDCIDGSCVRPASSAEQVSEHKSRVIGFKSHVKLTLCLEYILYMIIYDIYV